MYLCTASCTKTFPNLCNCAMPVQVPTNSYEVNFVFSDGEWRFENNGGNDFKFPVLGEG